MPERLRVRAVIQCAMDMEATPFLSLLEGLDGGGPKTLRVGSHEGHIQTFNFGALDGHEVLVVTSGIGLANAASASARALGCVDAPIVIAAGTTGGLARDSEVGDIAAGIATSYGNADATAFGYEPGQIPGMPVDYHSSENLVSKLDSLAESFAYRLMRGRVVSSDSFITAPLAGPLRERFPDAIGADMETCAMAQIAWAMGVDWVSLRAVSDLCGPSAGQDFHMDSREAADRSFAAVRAFLAL